MTTATMPALACVPDALRAHAWNAHARLARRLFARVEAPVPVDEPAEGYRLALDASDFDDVARWIANERLCCPFLRFTLDVAPAGGALTMTLSGPEGTRAFLDAELFAAAQVSR